MKIKLKIITMLAITIVVLMSFTSTHYTGSDDEVIHYTGSDDEVVNIGYQYLWNKDVFCVQHGLNNDRCTAAHKYIPDFYLSRHKLTS